MSRSEDILDAAEQCMRQKGFHQTSIHTIAGVANVSVGLVYKYYKNKEAIIEALVRKIVERMISLLNSDFHKVSRPANLPRHVEDIVPHEIENSIMLLMEISSESTRNERIRHIMHDAWQGLKNKYITQEQVSNPDLEADVIHTRLYVMSLVIDGMIIRQCMKNREIPDDFMPFFDLISCKVNLHDADPHIKKDVD